MKKVLPLIIFITALSAVLISVQKANAYNSKFTLEVQPIPCDVLILAVGVTEASILQPNDCQLIVSPDQLLGGEPSKLITVVQRDENSVSVQQNTLQNASFPKNNLSSAGQGTETTLPPISTASAYAVSGIFIGGSIVMIDWAFFGLAIIKFPLALLSKLIFWV